MMTSWHSLYFPSDDSTALAHALTASLESLGYTLYNPFGLLPGKAYPQTVRLFVAPAVDGWTRAIGAPDERQFALLAESGLCLWAALDGSTAHITVYQDGKPVAPQTALLPHLRPGCTPEQLQATLDPTTQPNASAGSALPLDALPEDVRAMAGDVNLKQAEKMFSRLGGQLLRKATTDADTADAARGLLNSGPDWNSADGTRLRAFMACLTVPETWREPDFVTLRDAYQLHERRRRKPDARLYPGDAEAMAQVPDALTYTPIYGGLDA
ncbi:MAG: hypothetical protein H6672_06510 [Anaerolineaceae bacterium]|nr:hypothetical protein [Anaerolineaceae bacterium]